MEMLLNWLMQHYCSSHQTNQEREPPKMPELVVAEVLGPLLLKMEEGVVAGLAPVSNTELPPKAGLGFSLLTDVSVAVLEPPNNEPALDPVELLDDDPPASDELVRVVL